jgi:hypothetical protein
LRDAAGKRLGTVFPGEGPIEFEGAKMTPGAVYYARTKSGTFTFYPLFAGLAALPFAAGLPKD